MTSRQYQQITAGLLLLALVGVAFGWRWADQTYRTGARARGYWIGVGSSSLPALVLAGCALWLWLARKRGEPAAHVRWLNPLQVLSMVFLAFMAVFPLL